MGAEQSRQEEQLWSAVKAGDEDGVKALHNAGASLEALNRKGRTPLMVACDQPLDMSDMVQLLLSLGANPDHATRTSSSPLEYAAARGHADTVSLLLSYGADPWAVNEVGATALDVARAKEHASVVRVIEGSLCLFSGTVRETKGGNGFLDVLVPELLTKKVWVVVLPAGAPHLGRSLHIFIYQQQELSLWTGGAAGLRDVAVPRTVLHLEDCLIEDPTWDRPAPVLVITHRTTKTKYRFLSEVEGDKAQLEAFWKACKGSPQAGTAGASSSSSSTPSASFSRRPAGKLSPEPGIHVPTAGHVPAQGLQVSRRSPWVNLLAELVVLIAKTLWHVIDMNIKVDITREAPGVNINVDMGDATPGTKRIDITYGGVNPRRQSVDSSSRGVGRGDSGIRRPSSSTRETGHGDLQPQPQRAGTSSVSQATAPIGGDSRDPLQATAARAGSLSTSTTPVGPARTDSVSTVASAGSDPALPSAPPLPAEYLTPEGHVSYPTVDTSPVEVDGASTSASRKASESTKPAGGGGGQQGQCVICWDAPAQAACVPCGHLVGCMDCLSGIKKKGLGCPVCRAPIQQVLRVFQG